MLTAGGRGGGCLGWGTRSLGLDDLPEASDQALVVLHGVQLDARLDDIHGAHAAVSDRAAQTSAKRAIQVVPAEWRRVRRSGHNAAAKTSKRKTKDCILRVVLVPVVHRSTVTDHFCTIPCRVASLGNARIKAFETGVGPQGSALHGICQRTQQMRARAASTNMALEAPAESLQPGLRRRKKD